jgi:DNA-binding NtrC family response regulator
LTEVLLMTADGSIGDVVTAMNDSSVDYLRKPFEIDRLVAVIARIEERRCSKDTIVALSLTPPSHMQNGGPL